MEKQREPINGDGKMTIAYFDLSSGIAGDMVLGALVDLGFPMRKLNTAISAVGLRSVVISASRRRGAFRGVNLTVAEGRRQNPAKYHDRGYREIDKMIASSKLNAKEKSISRAIFFKLASAEAAVHNVSVGKVHFHEAGSVDSIVDVVGTAAALAHFDFDEIHSSPVPFARGRVRCAHGVLPVPAPAVLELMKGLQVCPCPVREEIVTPTGAAILAVIADKFGECPLQKIKKVGYGFGDKVVPGIPNALSVITGEGFSAVVIEANIDDMNPQLFENAVEKIFSAGAVDVALVPILMKKGRPGTRIEAIVPWARKEPVIDAILRETTSFGVRYYPVERRVLSRELSVIKRKTGSVTYKLGYDDAGRLVKAMPEYEDAKRLAKKLKRPLIEVLNGLAGGKVKKKR